MNTVKIPTSIWQDDSFLELSPEQKLLFLYIATSPFLETSGSMRVRHKMMAFQLGLQQSAFLTALKALHDRAPDLIDIQNDLITVNKKYVQI